MCGGVERAHGTELPADGSGIIQPIESWKNFCAAPARAETPYIERTEPVRRDLRRKTRIIKAAKRLE